MCSGTRYFSPIRLLRRMEQWLKTQTGHTALSVMSGVFLANGLHTAMYTLERRRVGLSWRGYAAASVVTVTCSTALIAMLFTPHVEPRSRRGLPV